jgi:putative DNA primase/helicase
MSSLVQQTQAALAKIDVAMTAPKPLRARLSRLAAAASEGVLPEVVLTRGDSVVLEPVHWLLPRFLPLSMLSILAGAPGCGKTTLALCLAAAVTGGAPWPDGTMCREPGDVLIISMEDDPAVLAARLAAADADMTRVHIVQGLRGAECEAFDPGRDMDLLQRAAEKLPRLMFVIIDPIVSAVVGDGHKSNDVRRSLQPVVALAQRLGCAVLGISHFSKGTKGNDPAERITGSIAYVAQARVVMVAAKLSTDNEGDVRVVALAKSNIGPDSGGLKYTLVRREVAPDVEGQCVQWLGTIDGTAREILADAEQQPDDPDESSALGEAMQFLRSELRDGPKPAKKMFNEAHNAGHAERTIKRAKALLKIEARKEPTGWMWALSDDRKGANAGPLPKHGPLDPLGTVGPERRTTFLRVDSRREEGQAGQQGQEFQAGDVGTLDDAEVF